MRILCNRNLPSSHLLLTVNIIEIFAIKKNIHNHRNYSALLLLQNERFFSFPNVQTILLSKILHIPRIIYFLNTHHQNKSTIYPHLATSNRESAQLDNHRARGKTLQNHGREIERRFSQRRWKLPSPFLMPVADKLLN